MPIALAPFDPSRDFEARTFFRAAGVIYSKDQPFDKVTVNPRVLRQLYDARKISYASVPAGRPGAKKGPLAKLLKHFKGAVVRHHAGDLTPVEAHEAIVAEQEQESEGAPGTAREAPGAEASTSAESGTASAPQQTAADVVEDTVTSGAEAAVAPEGEAATAAATEFDAKVDELMVNNSQSALLTKAEGLAGATSKTPKLTLARMLVTAGRA